MGILYFFLEIILIVIFSLLILNITKTTEKKIIENPYLVDLIKNWSIKPIKDLYITNNDIDCKRNFLVYNWEGVPNSCDCKNTNNISVKGDIFKQKCTFYKKLLGCKNIEAINSINTNYWKNSKICVKEYELDYSNIITIVGDTCPKNYLLCGKDTKNFSLCFPTKYGCPINQIKFSNSPKRISDKYTNTLRLNNDWYLHFSNKFINSTIPIEIKYSEGRPCINPEEINIKSSYLKFKKSYTEIQIEKENEKNKLHKYCNSKIQQNNFDERFISLDSISKFKFFSDNNISNLLEKLQVLNFQDLISEKSNLYYRSYNHWSPFCKIDKDLNPLRMLEDITKLSVIDTFYFCIVIYILYLFSLNIIIFIFTWGQIYFRYEEVKENKFKLLKISNESNFSMIKNVISENFLNYMDNFILFIKRLLIFSSIALICGILLNINISENYKNLIDRFETQKCGDFITNEGFVQIGKKVNSIILNNYQILFYSILLLGFVILKSLFSIQMN